MSALPNVKTNHSAPRTERSEKDPLAQSRIMMNPTEENHPLAQSRILMNPREGEHLMESYDSLESFNMSLPPESRHRASLYRKQSQYYDSAFATRSPHHTAKDRVLRDSVVHADMVTNASIESEYTFLTDLSYNLSHRYQRPESSIFCSLNPAPMLILDGSMEPAYILTITAHPSLLQPVTNKRNAALLATGMLEALHIPRSRGLIRFIPVAEHCYAIGGRTLAAEIAEHEAALRAVSPQAVVKKRTSFSALRGLSLRRARAPELAATMEEDEEDEHEGFVTLSAPSDDVFAGGEKAEKGKGPDTKAEKEEKIKARKSFADMIFNR